MAPPTHDALPLRWAMILLIALVVALIVGVLTFAQTISWPAALLGARSGDAATDRGCLPARPGIALSGRPSAQDVTLHRIIVHVIYDVARHAGQADIMREQHDGAVGWQRENTNVPDDYDWPAYVTKLTIVDRFG